MGWMLNPELSKKCREFLITRWGKDVLSIVKERPVTWTRYSANPQLRLLRRKQKGIPLISVRSSPNRIQLVLSTERIQSQQ